ncbi:hypothetical protein [Pseudomonas sp. TUM22785]|uniref:hypothetical protein n=1 Tax=Pseudomonas sp. TUM22785 TaxID=3019098 RepID=UPI0023054AFB|nr:hypothetical protein [Pseudomonas sp. TUM22785]WCD81187.1 hypothetical protein PI990_04000 [Pseudomonas sp. TUM22785]
MSSKTEIIQQFIASGAADFAEANSSNSYYCSHHPSITPLVKKPPKELDDATLQTFYYYLLLNGGTPPTTSELQLGLLARAAEDAAQVLAEHGYPRCRLNRWEMVLLFDGEMTLDAHARRLALLAQVGRFAHQPGMLAKKQKLKAEFGGDAWLHGEIARVLRAVPFARLTFNRDNFDLSLPLVGMLFIYLLGADEADQRELFAWLKHATDAMHDIPNYKTRDQLVRSLAWVLFRFAEAADAKVLEQAMLAEYGETWCRDYP